MSGEITWPPSSRPQNEIRLSHSFVTQSGAEPHIKATSPIQTLLKTINNRFKSNKVWTSMLLISASVFYSFSFMCHHVPHDHRFCCEAPCGIKPLKERVREMRDTSGQLQFRVPQDLNHFHHLTLFLFAVN